MEAKPTAQPRDRTAPTRTGPGTVPCDACDGDGYTPGWDETLLFTRIECEKCAGLGAYLEGKCFACGAAWPVAEMQAVGSEFFGPCCPQECQDCPKPATQMLGGECYCDECARKRDLAGLDLAAVAFAILEARG